MVVTDASLVASTDSVLLLVSAVTCEDVVIVDVDIGDVVIAAACVLVSFLALFFCLLIAVFFSPWLELDLAPEDLRALSVLVLVLVSGREEESVWPLIGREWPDLASDWSV